MKQGRGDTVDGSHHPAASTALPNRLSNRVRESFCPARNPLFTRAWKGRPFHKGRGPPRRRPSRARSGRFCPLAGGRPSEQARPRPARDSASLAGRDSPSAAGRRPPWPVRPGGGWPSPPGRHSAAFRSPAAPGRGRFRARLSPCLPAQLFLAGGSGLWEGRRMVHIAELPEDILLDLFSLVPGRDLIRNCRLVCSQWRGLVDLATLWKRKCQREGYLPKGQDRSVPDWKIFYFLCILKRNLIHNPCAEDDFNYWAIDANGGDRWKIEASPGAHGREFPHLHVKKYFVTSYGLCTKHQLIDLKKEGYWEELMDETKPDIVVKDWYAARYDCGCQFKLNVKLLSRNYLVLEEFDPEDVVIEQWSDAEWREVSHTFHNYPSGVRYILFSHGGQDTQFWAGWYGVRVTNSSITIGPEVAS